MHTRMLAANSNDGPAGLDDSMVTLHGWRNANRRPSYFSVIRPTLVSLAVMNSPHSALTKYYSLQLSHDVWTGTTTMNPRSAPPNYLTHQVAAARLSHAPNLPMQ